MRLALLVSALAIVASAPSLAQVAEGPSRTFQAADLFGLRTAGDPQVRPDGGAIAYVRTTYDIMTDEGHPSIWLIDSATGAQTPLVVDDNANMRPRWSPDGSRLAYVSFENKKPVVYVQSLETGERRAVANFRGSNSSPARAARRSTFAGSPPAAPPRSPTSNSRRTTSPGRRTARRWSSPC
jgi:Tol biopolymer transport system component